MFDNQEQCELFDEGRRRIRSDSTPSYTLASSPGLLLPGAAKFAGNFEYILLKSQTILNSFPTISIWKFFHW